jgi:thiol-disulfide isomerase/thioredoxin
MIRHLVVALVMAALALPAAAAAATTTAPKVGIDSFDQLQTPLPYPYDEAANANVQIARAKARARASGKLLLVDLGGNWCGDCRILSATMARPELKAFVSRHFQLVMVDVGHYDKNLQIPAHWGITERLEGVPALLVVDPRTDKLLDGGRVSALEDARHMTPQALADWLAQWPH